MKHIDVVELLREARVARSFAHAPFSQFPVGAALLTGSGKVIRGCNVENSSYGLTVCAERVALFTAIAEGERTFRALAISADADTPVPPCGACRQVISDLAGDIPIIIDAGKGRPKIYRLKELLPMAFTTEHLSKGRKR